MIQTTTPQGVEQQVTPRSSSTTQTVIQTTTPQGVEQAKREAADPLSPGVIQTTTPQGVEQEELLDGLADDDLE